MSRWLMEYQAWVEEIAERWSLVGEQKTPPASAVALSPGRRLKLYRTHHPDNPDYIQLTGDPGLRTGQPMPVAEQSCTLLSADLWDTLSPQASSMDVHTPHEACGFSYNGCTDARRPAYECPFFVHSETLNFELMWRRKYRKKFE